MEIGAVRGFFASLRMTAQKEDRADVGHPRYTFLFSSRAAWRYDSSL
jgi:hypothetical protein